VNAKTRPGGTLRVEFSTRTGGRCRGLRPRTASWSQATIIPSPSAGKGRPCPGRCRRSALFVCRAFMYGLVWQQERVTVHGHAGNGRTEAFGAVGVPLCLRRRSSFPPGRNPRKRTLLAELLVCQQLRDVCFRTLAHPPRRSAPAPSSSSNSASHLTRGNRVCRLFSQAVAGLAQSANASFQVAFFFLAGSFRQSSIAIWRCWPGLPSTRPVALSLRSAGSGRRVAIRGP
jgi:hypothetical protein